MGNEKGNFTPEEKVDFTLKPEWIGAVFGGFGLAMIATDNNGNITMINEKATNLLGVECKPTIGKPLSSLISIMDCQENRLVALPIRQVLDLGIKISSDEGYALKDLPTGGRQVSFSMGRIRNEVGEVVGAVMRLSCLVALDTPNSAATSDSMPTVVAPNEASLCNTQSQSIFVRSNGRYVRIMLTDLLWIEAMENYVQLQTSKEKFVVHTTLKNIADTLACHGFQRIHRSFIVKTSAIESIEENHVSVQGTALPIGKSYRTELLGMLTLI